MRETTFGSLEDKAVPTDSAKGVTLAVGESGVFPFGQLNLTRPMRMPAGDASAIVVGVYPSAFHVAWSPPPETGVRRFASLAVDVEPTVFWDGIDPSPAALLDAWKTTVGFDPQRHGTIAVGKNGPSGNGLNTEILNVLGIDPSTVAFTDAWPSFFVKHGPTSQGAAIKNRFNPVAAELGLVQSTLPARPTSSQLVALVNTSSRRDDLRHEIMQSKAPLVITLGQESIDSLRSIADEVTGVQTRLSPNGYGQRGHVTIDGKHLELLPLAHPGFIRQTNDPAWLTALNNWKRETGLQALH